MSYGEEIEYFPPIEIYGNTSRYGYSYGIGDIGYYGYGYSYGIGDYGYGGGGGVSASGDGAVFGATGQGSFSLSYITPSTHTLPKIVVAAATKVGAHQSSPVKAKTRAQDKMDINYFDKLPGGDIPEFLKTAVDALVAKFGNPFGRTLTVITDIEHVDIGNRERARPALNFTHSEDKRFPGTTNNRLYIGPVGPEVYDGTGTSPVQSITHELTHVFFPGEGKDIYHGVHQAEFYQHLYEVITALHEYDAKNGTKYFDGLELSQHDYNNWLVAVGLKAYNPQDYKPVVLDLDGNGIALAPLTSSNTFFDMAGDGYQHRTAWAGAGDAVLAFDANNDGVIDQKNEIIFTEWDPTAVSDMQALRNVFDTDANGQLDAGDDKFSQFKLIITNADGTKTLQSLTQAGIASIELKEDNSSQVFIDGSSIDGQTSFTRADGTSGVAATVTLMSEATGYALQTTTATDANGAVTVDNKAYNPDGSLASETISVISADGASRTLSRDIDGDGVIDLIQTELTVVNGDGSRTTTLTDKTAGGVALDKIVTTTSADGMTTTIQRDMDGGGIFEQTETLTTNAGGSKTNAVSNFSDDGTLINTTSITTSANGLTRTDRVDENGDGVWETISTDVTVVNADESRTETLTVSNANGSLRAQAIIQSSPDGRTKTTQSDLDGDGTIDLTTSQTVVPNADGSYWTTTTNRNNNNSLRDQTKTLLSADNLSKTTYVDVNGDGFFEKTLTDVTVVAANGDRTETTTALNADGTKRAQTIVVKGADGRSRTTQVDSNGDGVFDVVETITIAANGSTVDTVANYSPKNSVIAKNVVTTSADGLTRTSQFDADANGTWDTTTTEATVENANGASTKTTTVTNSNGSLRGKSVVSTSANGLSITTQVDLDGNGAYDVTTTDVRTVAADNSHVQTVTTNNANGSLLNKAVTTVSADRHTTTVNRDIDGDNVNDQTETVQLQTNGAVVDTVSNFQTDGSLKNQRVSTVSADRLASQTVYSEMTPHTDLTWVLIWPWGWFPVYNTYVSLDATKTVTDVTTLNADGSRTQTYTDYYGAYASVHEQIVTTTSANGLSISKQWTGWNGATAINQTSSDITTYNADGSTTRIILDQSPNGYGGQILLDKAVMTISASKLVTNYQLDVNGDGTYDTAGASTVGVDGATVDSLTVKNLDGSLRRKEVTTVSWDGRTQNAVRDTDGDGALDHFESRRVEESGANAEVTWETKANGALDDRIVSLTSADGLSTTVALDTDGDGAADRSQLTFERFNDDGSQTVTISDLNANGTLRGRTITTISADGLSKTSQFDLSGLGDAINTGTDITVLNADGSATRTVTDYYADGSLMGKSVFTTSANGKSVTTTVDIDGDNVNDKTVSMNEGADGVKVSTVTFKDGATVTTTTSFDGLTTTRAASSGNTQVTTELGDGTGSYSWSVKDSSGTLLASSSHTIDENHIDTYVYKEADPYLASGYFSATVRIDTATFEQYLSMSKRLYDTAFDRDMLINEKELIGTYIDSATNAFDATQMANDLMSSEEFSTRYGGLTNLEFIERFFQNALNRNSSVSELTNYLQQLNSGAMTRADVMNAISEGAEHIASGNVHATTNNSVLSSGAYAFDHAVDKQYAKDMVTRLYQTALGRAPTATELSNGVQAIVSGSKTDAGLANQLLSVTWILWPYFWTPSLFSQTYGSLSNTDFVTRLYLNSFGRNPTAQESSDWVTMLNNGKVTRYDLIYALAESPDHLAYIGAQAGEAITATAQTLTFAENAIARVTGEGNTINASSGDVLTIGGNGVNGLNNVVNVSYGSVSLLADSRMDVVGSTNAITVAAGSSVGVNGDDNIVSASGDSVWVNGGSGNIVNGSDNLVHVAAYVGANIVGEGNTIDAQAGAKLVISTNGEGGVGDIINMSDGSLLMAGGAEATINGSSNEITLEYGNTLSVVGSQNTVVFGAGDDVLTDEGSSETFVFHENFGQDTITGFDITDRIEIDSAVFADWADLLGSASQSGGDTIITVDAANSVTLKNVALSSLNESQFQFS
jgi:hypothetical protein